MENFSRLTQEIFKMNSILHFLLLICLLFHNGWSQNSVITCPSPIYREGNNELTLVIKTADFTTCDVPPTSVICEWFSNTGTVRTICTQSVTSCDGNLTSRGCRCAEQNGQNYEYKLAFSKSSDDVTGNISCTVDCVVYDPNDPKATVRTDSTCQNIAFVSKCAEMESKCEPGVCRINETDEPFCDCTGTLRTGQYCNDFSDEVGLIIAFITIFFILSGIFLVFWWFITSKESTTEVEQDGGVLDTPEHIKEFRKLLQKEACATLHVEVCNNPLVPCPVVILKSRNIFTLLNAKKKIPDVIRRMQLDTSTHTDERVRAVPTLDTNSRSMRPNGSSERATNGRTNETPL